MSDASFDAPPFLGGVHVLLVEHDHDSLEVLKAILEYAGALVAPATSAREALRALERIMPDVIIVDLAMPGEDGYRLIGDVRSKPHIWPIAAIALASQPRPEDRRRALEAGFQGYLSKPVDPWELCRLVAGLARRGG